MQQALLFTRWLLRPGPRNVVAWVIALTTATGYVGTSWWFDGHITCDFASQWLQGRMLARGDGDNMYRVEPQREALRDGYEHRGYGPDAFKKMDEDILQKGPGWDKHGIEGPLYPPTMGLLMWPFAMLEPRAAHAVLVLLYAQLGFVTAWLIRIITQNKVQVGEAAALILLFPNYAGAMMLGQNSPLTLFIIAAGWLLWTKRWPLAAGIVWGLLAYKPVFAVALIWVPLVLGNRQMLMGMIGSGAAFCWLTVPFVGLESWHRWWLVGRNAAEMYGYDRNWIWMSRDLLGLPRRAMWDWEHFSAHVQYVFGHRDWDESLLQAVQIGPAQTAIGWGLLLGVIAVTVIVFRRWARRTARQSTAEPQFAHAFLLFGALLTCYHFMHYDLLPMALPALLLVASANWLRPWQKVLLTAVAPVWYYLSLDINAPEIEWLPLRTLGCIRIPFETFLLLLAWAWTGWLILKDVRFSVDDGALQSKVEVEKPVYPAAPMAYPVERHL